MESNFGRSRIIEIFAVIIAISCRFVFFNKKPLGEFCKIEEIQGDLQVHLRYDKEEHTDNGVRYIPQTVTISANENKAAVDSILAMLSQLECRKVKGRSSMLAGGANLETIYVTARSDTAYTEMFISNEYSTLYIIEAKKGGSISTAYDVPRDTFDILKEMICENSDI